MPKTTTMMRLPRFVPMFLTGATVLAGCQSKTPPAPSAPTVTAAHPVAKRVSDWTEYTGRLDSNQEVEIRARVSGYLEKVHFTEGQRVDAGDLLFTIDQRPFQAEVSRARATLAQAKAAAELAANNLRRAEALIAKNAISREEFDVRKSQLDQTVAAVAAAAADLQTAELNLGYTEIRSPISGITGEHAVNIGNLINGGSASSTLLTTVVPHDPIYVYFEMDEASQLASTRRRFNGELPGESKVGQAVEMQLADENGFPHKGTIDFVDNRLNANTATLRVRGRFDNAAGLLTPGMFARVRVQSSREYDALLVPDAVIGSNQSVKYVWVLDENNQARQQEVTLGPLDGELRIVRSGLSADDRIVVRGTQLVRAGTPLNVAMEDAPAKHLARN